MAEPKVSENKTPEFLGTGRRKTSIARVRLISGNGKIVVNGRPFENYFPMDTLRVVATQPLTVTGTADKFDELITYPLRGSARMRRHATPEILLTVSQ